MTVATTADVNFILTVEMGGIFRTKELKTGRLNVRGSVENE
jgi:hypothetical protein